MAWMRVTLSNQDIMAGKSDRLINDFMAAFMAAGAPKRAAMFADHPMGGDSFYFSPDAVALFSATLAAYRPMACEAPQRGRSALIAGEADAWTVLPSASASRSG